MIAPPHRPMRSTGGSFGELVVALVTAGAAALSALAVLNRGRARDRGRASKNGDDKPAGHQRPAAAAVHGPRQDDIDGPT